MPSNINIHNLREYSTSSAMPKRRRLSSKWNDTKRQHVESVNQSHSALFANKTLNIWWTLNIHQLGLGSIWWTFWKETTRRSLKMLCPDIDDILYSLCTRCKMSRVIYSLRVEVGILLLTWGKFTNFKTLMLVCYRFWYWDERYCKIWLVSPDMIQKKVY